VGEDGKLLNIFGNMLALILSSIDCGAWFAESLRRLNQKTRTNARKYALEENDSDLESNDQLSSQALLHKPELFRNIRCFDLDEACRFEIWDNVLQSLKIGIEDVMLVAARLPPPSRFR
jgi:hypothetical protein